MSKWKIFYDLNDIPDNKWLPKRDIDPLIKKQLELTTNMLSKEHQIGHDLAKELFKETAKEISYVGIADKQGKLHTIHPIKKGENK